MDECILYGMGGHKKQGSERGSTDRERVWKPRRALNQVELILRPFSLVKIILFFSISGVSFAMKDDKERL